MIRTQVYITESIYQRIELLANQEHKPKAEVLRELLEQGLGQRREESVGDALRRLVDLGKRLKVQGPRDLSQNIDHYLYDE